MELLIATLLAPTLGAIGGAIFGKFASNSALRRCEAARKACNDQLHALKAQMMTSQARVAALEVELDRRITVLESNNAR